ncbi:MAG: M56 family metallopeptidase [Hyphomonadaceae bacterium]
MNGIFAAITEANIAAALAIVLVLLLRTPVRKLAGPHAAYMLWALVPVAMTATLIPARAGVATRIADIIPAATPGGQMTPMLAKSAAAPLDMLALLLSVTPSIWFCGMIAGFAYLAIRQIQFAGDAWRGIAGPAVMGVFRPRIVTPSDFAQRYDQAERALILEHETAHLRRGDARLNAVVALAQCVCWFNPLIHLGARLMRIDQELSCDALVIEQQPDARRAYAETLLKTQLAGRPLPFGCYWPARSKHPLTQRIAMIAASPLSRRRRLAARAAVLVTIVSGRAAAWAIQPEQPPAQAQQTAVAQTDTSAKRAYETYQRVFELMGGRFPRASDTPDRYQELLGDRWVDADRARNVLEGLDPDVRSFLASRPDSQLLPGGRTLQPGEESALSRMTARYSEYFEQLKATPLSNT